MGIGSSEFNGLRWYTNGTPQGTRRSLPFCDVLGLITLPHCQPWFNWVEYFPKGPAYLCSLMCNYYWSFIIFMVILSPRTSRYHIYTGKDKGSINSLGITIKAKGKRKYTGVSGKALLHWWCNCFLKTGTEIDISRKSSICSNTSQCAASLSKSVLPLQYSVGLSPQPNSRESRWDKCSASYREWRYFVSRLGK